MMFLLRRYIGRVIFQATAMVLLMMSGVLLLMNVLTELKNIGEGDYGLAQAIIYVFMRMPLELYQFVPILILLGCIAGLSILSNTREVVVMRALGFSMRQIMRSVLAAVMLMLLVFCFIGEYIAPRIGYVAEVHKEYAKNAGQAVMTAEGVWLHIENNFVHIETVIDKSLLQNITRYEFDDQHRLQAAYYAKQLRYEHDQWMMHDVVKTSFYGERARSEDLAEVPWNLPLNRHLLSTGSIDPSDMSLKRLMQYTQFLEKNGLQANGYKYEFWQRILLPFAAMIMVFLALPFVLSLLSGATTGRRLMVGLGVGFTFFILKSCLGQLSIVYQVPPFLAALFPLVLFALLALFLSHLTARS